MAVRLDLDAVRDAVDPSVFRDAEVLLSGRWSGEVAAAGGGASAVVDDVAVWVGVVAGALAAECDCAGAGPRELCVHAVAVTIAAVRAGFAWSSTATPPSRATVEPNVRRLTEIAAALPARRLAVLVGEHAAVDRRLEARLMTCAGKLGSPTDTELAAVCTTIDGIAAEATTGRWGLEDLAKAGRLIVDEVEVLAQRLPNEGTLAVVEHAARLWDELSVHLREAYYDHDVEDPREIGDALRAVHVHMCEQLDVDPDDLIDRLIDIITEAEISSCLDDPEDYRAVLGPDGVAAVRRGC